MPGGHDRAVSPVVGIALLLGILVLLVGVVSIGFVGFGHELSAGPFDRAVEDDPVSAEAATPYSYGDNITAVDDAAGATTRHVVTLNVTGNAVGNSLNQVTVDYRGGHTDVSDTAAGDDLTHLVAIGIDTDGDGRLDEDAMADVEPADFEAQNSGSKLVVELSGNHDLNADDQLVLVYEAVQNPSSSGTYDVDINLNGDRVYDGTLSIS